MYQNLSLSFGNDVIIEMKWWCTLFFPCFGLFNASHVILIRRWQLDRSPNAFFILDAGTEVIDLYNGEPESDDDRERLGSRFTEVGGR